MTKTAAKKLLKEQDEIPNFIDVKLAETEGMPDWNRAEKIGSCVELKQFL